jgi:hypothetical protein
VTGLPTSASHLCSDQPKHFTLLHVNHSSCATHLSLAMADVQTFLCLHCTDLCRIAQSYFGYAEFIREHKPHPNHTNMAYGRHVSVTLTYAVRALCVCVLFRRPPCLPRMPVYSRPAWDLLFTAGATSNMSFPSAYTLLSLSLAGNIYRSAVDSSARCTSPPPWSLFVDPLILSELRHSSPDLPCRAQRRPAHDHSK